MRTALDFTPYRRSLIGFDSMFDLIENAGRVEQLDPFPPYDIEQQSEDAYRIRIAIAGYTADDVEVVTHETLLTVTGRKEADSEERKFLYRGIPTSGRFERRFQLAPHVIVTGANLADGILEIELKREVPEAAKPRKVEIGKTPGRKRVAKAAADSTPKRQPEPQAA